MSAIALGFGLGFFVALQVGPMSLLLIRSTLRNGLAVGVAIGAGVALVDAAYAAAGAGGAAGAVMVDPLRIALAVAGSLVLAWLGLRMLYVAWQARTDLDGPTLVATPRRAFVIALAATASNPATIVSWAAIFGAASAASHATPLLLVVGVAFGSAVWMTTLACAVALLRRRITPRTVRVVDGVAGLGMLAFAGVIGRSAARS